ncbi:Hsp70 family protein [Caulobacter sp. KR2-114]|uniref:Hsp70 family protein n=1 Tax=Caulobacter sp. KR2-114 TaxID=3400912 RepID=UPI003C03CC08
MPSRGAIGIDFGTTNTVISTTDADGAAHLIVFPNDGAEIVAFRSALSFHSDPQAPSQRVVEAGPWAIEAYVEEPLETRFIQSFKSYAASPLFQDTEVLGRRYRFEDLLSTFLLRLRAHAGGALDEMPATAIVGRPVNFAGQRPDPALAVARYQTAFERLGFSDIRYAYEPVAAAFFFARKLKADATVLVADFGGGTSDFSLVRFTRRGGEIQSQALANSGVGLAGDAFDYRIIDHLVSPELGKGTSYRTFDNVAPIPNRYFTAFARWEQLALLRASRDMRDIRGLRRTAVDKFKIERLVELLDDNHGYRLYQSVSRLKESLSAAETATFLFEAGDIHIEKSVRRADFEAWITPELTAIEGAVDQVLATAGLRPEAVDRVFLTGGSSFVPAVRRLFAERFGEAKLEGGGELVSIASGLAYMGLERDLDGWTERAG